MAVGEVSDKRGLKRRRSTSWLTRRRFALRLVAVDVFEGDTSEDIVQKILTNGGREDIARVYVNGKECV